MFIERLALYQRASLFFFVPQKVPNLREASVFFLDGWGYKQKALQVGAQLLNDLAVG